jgi:hypothetical protein
VKSIKEVNNDLQDKPKVKKMTLEEAKTVEYTSSRQIPVEARRGQSKFS